MTHDEPTHDELVEQAETMIDAVEAYQEAIGDLKTALRDEMESFVAKVGPLRLLLISVFMSGVMFGAYVEATIP